MDVPTPFDYYDPAKCPQCGHAKFRRKMARTLGCRELGVVRGRKMVKTCNKCNFTWRTMEFFLEDVQPANFSQKEVARRLRLHLSEMRRKMAESMSLVASDLDVLDQLDPTVDENEHG